MVFGNPPLVPQSRTNAREDRPDIEQLRVASACGDLAAVQIILSRSLASRPSEQIEKRHFVVALAAAVTNNHGLIAAHLLYHGVPLNIGLFVCATKMKSYPMLQLFLDCGWDINEPIDRVSPPPLMYVTLAQFIDSPDETIGWYSTTKPSPGGSLPMAPNLTLDVESIVLRSLLPSPAHHSL